MSFFANSSDASSAESFFATAWQGYARLTPDAPRVHSLLEARGDTIVNDHVALRTFRLPGIERLDLGRNFEAWGYRRAEGDLDFPEKKLVASYWTPPSEKLATWPKIFISELKLEECSMDLQAWIRALVEPVLPSLRAKGVEVFLEPSWNPPAYADYARFLPESEYAAWTAAFGIQVNHFTVFMNALRSFPGLAELGSFLEANGFELNAAGGKIKGHPSEKLEQSSTRAREVPGTFAGGESARIPGCYYEFARRYPLGQGGELFQGFVPASANKLFESTDARK